jgi:hypothetical protein
MVNIVRWSLGVVLLLLVFTGSASAQTDTYVPSPALVVGLANADQTFIGEDIGDWAGYFASPAGDVNGDGLGDLLIGAPLSGNKICPYPLDPEGNCPGTPKGEGETYLILGRPDGEWPSGPLDLADADASFVGCETNSMTGRQIYTAGDVNGDGYDDFLISGWKCGTNYTGKVYLFLGRPDINWGAQFPVEEADASFVGEHEGDFLGYYTATVGDVNGDGYDDFIITSTHNDQAAPDAGKAYLILGRAEADWGRDFPISQADATFLGTAAYDRLGRSAVGVGDVNGDGYGDFLIASIASSSAGILNAGESYLFLGRPGGAEDLWGHDFPVAQADATFVGEGEGDEAGRRVAWAGDVNGDGYDDFLIGSARNDHGGTDAGIGYLILGRKAADWGRQFSLANADASFVGEALHDQAGRRLSGAGDVNNDGYDDFIIGAPHNSRGGFASGSAYVIFGRPEADWGSQYPLREADIIYVGKPDIGVAGYDSGWLGDFNGDGIDDIFIAAYGGRNDAMTAGEVYLILGGTEPLVKGYRSDVDESGLAVWRRFTGAYWDPNGWEDLAEVQLALGRTPYDPMGLDVKYEVANKSLYLRSTEQDVWLGPCEVGEAVRLSNEVVALDCLNTHVRTLGAGTLEVTWRATWLRSPSMTGQLAFTPYLRATDKAGQVAESYEASVWRLSNWRLMLPLVSRQ